MAWQLKQNREIAIQAARGLMAFRDYKPDEKTATAALAILDDLVREQPYLRAAKWYINATENQIKLFRKEWNKARR